jgi:DNA-binding NtrC family response regulator
VEVQKVPSHRETQFVIGSRRIQDIISDMKHYADAGLAILLVGETGVGKDSIAQTIHQLCRKSGRFIPVPLKSLNDTIIESELFGHEKGAFTGAEKRKTGKLEAADGGTLYFPEITELSTTLQLKLLDFLQYRTFSRVGQNATEPEIHVDVQIILATNTDPDDYLQQKILREDFYHRINEARVDIPPLRERRGDIEVLAKHFARIYGIQHFGKEFSLSQDALELLQNYTWSGNVRELAYVIKRSLITVHANNGNRKDGHILTEDSIIKYLRRREGNNNNLLQAVCTEKDTFPQYNTYATETKVAYFRDLMKHTNGNISEAVRISGLTRQGLWGNLRRYGLR